MRDKELMYKILAAASAAQMFSELHYLSIKRWGTAIIASIVIHITFIIIVLGTLR